LNKTNYNVKEQETWEITMKKDVVNEYTGIISIIVIVILAVIGVYWYLFHQPQSGAFATPTIPVEAPAPD
jgi:amino acid transporter